MLLVVRNADVCYSYASCFRYRLYRTAAVFEAAVVASLVAAVFVTAVGKQGRARGAVVVVTCAIAFGQTAPADKTR